MATTPRKQSNGVNLKVAISIAIGSITLCTLFISGNLWVLGECRGMMEDHQAKPIHGGAMQEKEILRLIQGMGRENEIRFNRIDDELREIKSQRNRS
jgi:hypothetical protein